MKIKLSQCMIVKNEEKNIRRALSWGKDLMYEQIVVDTGSTDRTVEIAKEMGAKVYHFAWINDFSAAKNFAIEQATGDWIAFLDADEYIRKEDLNKLSESLEKIAKLNQSNKKDKINVIRLNLWNLEDDGSFIASGQNDRFFMNDSEVRYKNRIHEQLTNVKGKQNGIAFFDNIMILHTGYSESAYTETNKLERNIGLLKREAELEPDNMEWQNYLGDSYFAMKKFDLAQEAYEKVVTNKGVQDEMLLNSITGLIRVYTIKNEEEQALETYKEFLQWKKVYPDVEFYMGLYQMQLKKIDQAISYFETALEQIERYENELRQYTLYSVTKLDHIYQKLATAYFIKENKIKAVQNATLALKMKPYTEDMLIMLLNLFFKNGEKEETVYQFLEKIYDFTNQKDRLFVILAEKKAGFVALKPRLLTKMTEEEQEAITHEKRTREEIADRERLQRKYSSIPYHNAVDYYFMKMIEKIEKNSEIELFWEMKGKLHVWEEEFKEVYDRYQEEVKREVFWGKLQPEYGIYDTFHQKAHVLKQYKDDCIWLYQHLTDYKSKKILTAILMNWLQLDTDLLELLKHRDIKYFDLDRISVNEDTVFVDVGGGKGETVLDFLMNYGTMYHKIYSYEIKENLVDLIKDATRNYENIEVDCIGVGKEEGIWYVKEGEDQLSSYLLSTGYEKAIEVNSIDAMIKEPITLLKIDAQGMEEEVLIGSTEQIQKNKPQLAIVVHHRYEELFTIPRMIKELRKDYKLSLQYCGSSLVPNKIIILAV